MHDMSRSSESPFIPRLTRLVQLQPPLQKEETERLARYLASGHGGRVPHHCKKSPTNRKQLPTLEFHISALQYSVV